MDAYPTRTVAYACELFHAPHQPPTEAIQKLHNRYFEDGNPPYSSFAVTPVGPVLANPLMRPGALSQVAFLADRIQFREELGSLTCEDFSARVARIAVDAARATGLGMYAVQQVTIRSLISPRHWRQSDEFMRDALFGFGDTMEAFDKAAQIYGLRLVFPPTPDSPTTNTLRIENFAQDPRSLFLENQASYGAQVVNEGLRDLAPNVLTAYEFLVDQAQAFVEAFDHRIEE
ncbi:MAG: hypothetical protein H6828_11070 [Planctomycetes bacterium]|nr:hypothetical protein [Planctomycetota bacterium]